MLLANLLSDLMPNLQRQANAYEKFKDQSQKTQGPDLANLLILQKRRQNSAALVIRLDRFHNFQKSTL